MAKKKLLLDPNLMGPAQGFTYATPDDVNPPPDQIPIQRSRTVPVQPGPMQPIAGDVATAMGPPAPQQTPAPTPAPAAQPTGGVMGAMRQPVASQQPESLFSRLGFGGGDGDTFRDKLGKLGAIMMMLDPMSAHAGAAMLQLQQAGQTQRRETKRQNDTAQWIQSQGVKPAEAAYLAANPTALNAWNKQRLEAGTPDWELRELTTDDNKGTATFMVDKKTGKRNQISGVKPFSEGYTLAPGSTRYDANGKPIITAPEDPGKAPTIHTFHNPDGTDQDKQFVNGQWVDYGAPYAPSGMSLVSDPSTGKLTLTQGRGGAGGAAKGLTEAEQKTVGYRERMLQAEPDIQKFTPDMVTPTAAVANIGNKLLSGTSLEDIPYAIQDKNITAGTNSGRSWLTGVLRGDSGGAIQDQEWRDYSRIYIPMPGDDEAEIARKAARRKAVMDGIDKALGDKAGAPENDAKRRAMLDQYAAAQVDVTPAPAQQQTTPPAGKGKWTITPVT